MTRAEAIKAGKQRKQGHFGVGRFPDGSYGYVYGDQRTQQEYPEQGWKIDPTVVCTDYFVWKRRYWSTRLKIEEK